MAQQLTAVLRYDDIILDMRADQSVDAAGFNSIDLVFTNDAFCQPAAFLCRKHRSAVMTRTAKLMSC